jgi:hypothetical protein
VGEHSGNSKGNDGDAKKLSWFWDHWVFWAVLVSVALAALAGWIVKVPQPVPGWALEQQLIYRIEFAGILLALAYGLLIVLRLGWHNQTLSKMQLGPVSGEAPAEKAAADELSKLQDTITILSEETSTALEALDGRVQALEDVRRSS